MARILLYLQGVYFGITGLWPLAHIDSFLAVTGPKREVWLVLAVGVLVLVIGVTLLSAARQQQEQRSVWLLAFLSAVGLAGIDIRYALTDVILDVYLLDAAVEILIVLAWVLIYFRSARAT